MDLTQPFKALGLATDAKPSEVRQRWRELARTGIHPDHGGSTDEWLEWQAAYDKALALSRTSRICTACDGRGKLAEKGRGFLTTWTTCGKCEGSGRYQEF